MPSPRLGDIVEDHCGRCRRLTDHSIVAVVNGEVVKVRCRTCNHDQDFRHGEGPARKPTAKPSAFDQVLAGILASQPSPPGGASTAAKKPRAKRPRA